MSDEEAMTGAINRARHVIKSTDADYGVGIGRFICPNCHLSMIESGVHCIELNGDAKWFESGWVCICNKQGM